MLQQRKTLQIKKKKEKQKRERKTSLTSTSRAQLKLHCSHLHVSNGGMEDGLKDSGGGFNVVASFHISLVKLSSCNRRRPLPSMQKEKNRK